MKLFKKGMEGWKKGAIVGGLIGLFPILWLTFILPKGVLILSDIYMGLLLLPGVYVYTQIMGITLTPDMGISLPIIISNVIVWAMFWGALGYTHFKKKRR